MTETNIRQAHLDDTRAINAIFRSHINAWQRFDAQGRVESVAYDALTIYERWLHGGPWLSVETGALQLNRLLLGAGVALVAEQDGEVCAYAEGYPSQEPQPFGNHLNIGQLMTHAGHENTGLAAALVDAMREQAAGLGCQRLTVTCVGTDAETAGFYRGQGFEPLARVQRFSIPAKTGQIFYRAVEHDDPDPAQIHDWFMPLGRSVSARQQWERLWPLMLDTMPEIRERRIHRLHFNAAGQDALICIQQQLYNERAADVYCWSPKPLSNQVLSAICDWTHREGYRTLVTSVTEDTVKTLGPEAEADGYYQDVFALEV